MDMVLQICISDGSEIVIDGYDEISFYKEFPVAEVTHNAYSWQRDFYNDLLNNLVKYNYISVKRNDENDKLEYRDRSFAFNNGQISKNEPFVIRTNCITTIIDMYN